MKGGNGVIADLIGRVEAICYPQDGSDRCIDSQTQMAMVGITLNLKYLSEIMKPGCR